MHSRCKRALSRKRDHYLLNGRKLWITNGIEADIFVLFANANPETGYRGITAFIVEKFPGFSIGKKETSSASALHRQSS